MVLEFEEIRSQVYFERTEGAKSYADLLKPGIFRRVSLGMSMQMWSQLSGMNIMMYYIVYVFQGAGLSGRRGNLIADSVNYVLNVLFTSAYDLGRISCHLTILYSPCYPFHRQVGSSPYDHCWNHLHGILLVPCRWSSGPFRSLG